MPTLFRWLFYGFLGRAVGTMVALLAIYAIIEVFDKARYLGNGMTTTLLIEYLLLKTPYMISEFMPIILLVSASIYVSEISHHQELAALRAAGLGVNKLLLPLVSVGLLAALLNFAIGEWVTPTTNQRLDVIERVNIHNMPDQHRGIQWLKDGQHYYRLTPLTNGRFSMLMLETDAKGGWVRRIDAARAHYQNGTWILNNAHISRPSATEGMALEHQDRLSFRSNVGPDTADPPSPKHMQIVELARYAGNLERAGLAAGQFVLTLHQKLAAPLACLVMILLAVALSMNMGSRISATSKGLISAIVLGLIFYVLGNASSLLANGDKLPAAYAAWLPNLIFGGLAGFLILHREGK
ncbi:MAG TPA: LptF/LptG family permease [Mariprofundaceae bacterium]|nr:LptF/LptG family permease [Mariprofundaceae bacterium]